jgi:hypothetical protein
MRILQEFAISPQIKGSLFSWNGKYILKAEWGGLEQVFKVSETDVSGQEEVLNWARSEAFSQKLQNTFAEMDGQLDLLFN